MFRFESIINQSKGFVLTDVLLERRTRRRVRGGRRMAREGEGEAEVVVIC